MDQVSIYNKFAVGTLIYITIIKFPHPLFSGYRLKPPEKGAYADRGTQQLQIK